MPIREESKLPWAISGLLNGFRRLGPILFATGLLLVTCCGHDVNTTIVSPSQNITSGRNNMEFDAIHEGRLRQDNISVLMPASSRQKTSRAPFKYRISHHGKKRGRGSHLKGTVMSNTAPHENVRHNKQRRRGKGRGRGKGGKGQGKHRHSKSRQNSGDTSLQHSHIRRNLEKQLLVRNRTLELLGGGGARILWTSGGGNNNITALTNGTSDRNKSNSAAVLGESSAAQDSREKSQPQRLLAGLSIENNTSSDVVLQMNDRTIQSQVSLLSATVASGIKVDENITKSRGNAAFQFSERSQSVITPADDGRTRSIPAPVKTGADDLVMTDYQYDYDAIQVPGAVESSVWFNPTEFRNEGERTGVSSKGESLEPGSMQAAVGTTLATVLGVLTDHSGSGDSGETNKEEDDPCERWMRCKNRLQKAFLGPLGTLPSCPCHYPSAIFYDDKIWDLGQGKYFRWRDVSGEAERLEVYKPGAAYCIRSLLAQGSTSLAAQHCCYDRYRRLLTRGSGAGTPDFVSPEVSTSLHEMVDILPWRLCKGDFTRYNMVRPPNNENNCTANPNEEEFLRQVQIAQYF